jgi:hypothetical protein
MDRAEATGLGVAVAGHAALLAVLTLGFATVRQPPPFTDPMEVSIVEEIDLRSAAPEPLTEVPPPSQAPELGKPEEPAPAAPPELAPPVPEPAPQPEPLPPAPQPKPVPKPVETPPPPRPTPKAVPKPPPPAAEPTPRPVPKPTSPKVAAAKPAPAKPSPAKSAPAKAPPGRQIAAAKPAAKPGTAPKSAKPTSASGKGQQQAASGLRLGRDILKGIGSDPAPADAPVKASGAVLSPIALAGIKSAIQRQIQPCADRQVNPGPGANQIQVTLNLKLKPDGSLAASPTVVRTSGVNDENSRYEERVADLAIAAYRGCAPLRGLPDELYRTANGGWSNINMNYKLPG